MIPFNAAQFYEFLVEEDEPKACKAIPDDACTNVPANFTLNVANGTLTKLAEKIISPNITLPWIMSFLGASSIAIGALVPIKDAGSLLPQLAVSGAIRKKAIRKYYWVFSALVQAICWLVAGLVLWFLKEDWISWVILGLLAIFSMASGVASVSFKDVIAKTIPKETRGQTLSYRNTFGSVLGLVAGVVLVFFIQSDADRQIYAGLFLIASLLWFVAAALFYKIAEQKGATEGGRTPLQETRKGFSLVKHDGDFRNFLVTRGLLMAVPLVQPFFVLVAKNQTDQNWSLLGWLIIVNGLAQVISSPFWGKLADQSATRLMRIAACISIIAIGYALLFLVFPDWNLGFYAFMPVFFVNGVAYAGARLSRKTYLVDFAPKENRATYVSVANTVIGILTLVAAGLGTITEFAGLAWQMAFFVVLLVGAILMSFRLKSV